jgi:hypothetical protein
MRKVLLTVLIVVVCFPFTGIAQTTGEKAPEQEQKGRNMFVISPMIGSDKNTLHSRDRRGQPVDIEDTGLEYGLFALYSTTHFAVNNFLFFANVNDADVSGDIFFLNYYYKPESRITPNLGFGYIYHKIDLDQMEITVKTPLPKIGVRIGVPEWGMSFNPYLAWTSEKIETTRGDRTDEALLYGLTINWHWRFLGADAKYYYQDVHGKDKGYNVFRLDGNMFFSKHFGITARVDYMEHSTTDDLSFLIGPAFVF